MRCTIFAILSLAAALVHAAQTTSESSPVPIRWTVETSRVQPAVFDAYQGETLNLEATMQSYGRPFAAPVQPSLYWQTNGMGAAWWTAPATASGNVLRATWSPTNDCGGTVYNCFIGQAGGNYRAAFRLRMLPSPGYTPNHLPLPTVKDEIDPVFSAWLATNELYSACVDTNAVLGLITSATNGLATKSDLGGYLPLTGGTLTGNLALGEEYAGSRTLSIASDNGAQGIVLQGGTFNGEGGRVIIGGSFGRGGTFKVEGGAGGGGTMFVGGSPFTGGKLTVQGGGDRGGIIEVTEAGASIKKDGKEVATEYYVDAKIEGAVLPTNPTFSNAVLSVGLNIDTNSVAALNEIAETFGSFPIEGTATTVGGLLAALAAAVSWLRKNKADKATTLDGYGITDAAAKEQLVQVSAQSAYPIENVSDGHVKDRTINVCYGGGEITFPDLRTDGCARDFVVRVPAMDTAPTVVFPSTVRYESWQSAEDIFAAEAGKSNEWYFSESEPSIFKVVHQALAVVSQS